MVVRQLVFIILSIILKTPVHVFKTHVWPIFIKKVCRSTYRRAKVRERERERERKRERERERERVREREREKEREKECV